MRFVTIALIAALAFPVRAHAIGFGLTILVGRQCLRALRSLVVGHVTVENYAYEAPFSSYTWTKLLRDPTISLDEKLAALLRHAEEGTARRGLSPATLVDLIRTTLAEAPSLLRAEPGNTLLFFHAVVAAAQKMPLDPALRRRVLDSMQKTWAKEPVTEDERDILSKAIDEADLARPPAPGEVTLEYEAPTSTLGAEVQFRVTTGADGFVEPAWPGGGWRRQTLVNVDAPTLKFEPGKDGTLIAKVGDADSPRTPFNFCVVRLEGKTVRVETAGPGKETLRVAMLRFPPGETPEWPRDEKRLEELAALAFYQMRTGRLAQKP